MNIAIIGLGALNAALLGFCVYVLGIISGKMDLLREDLKGREEQKGNGEQEKRMKQFENLMSYGAGNRGNEFE